MLSSNQLLLAIDSLQGKYNKTKKEFIYTILKNNLFKRTKSLEDLDSVSQQNVYINTDSVFNSLQVEKKNNIINLAKNI